MSAWTDDDLGDLLRASFRDHEDPGDADHAVHLAVPAAYRVRRSRVLPAIAAVAAGIVVVGGLAGLVRYAAQHGSTASSSASSAAGSAQQRPPGSYVTGTATGAQIRTQPSYGPMPNGTPPPRPAQTSVGDARRLHALVRLVNGLRAAPRPGRRTCPPVTLQPGYTTLILRTSDGTWRFIDSDACTQVLQVDRDGEEVATLASTGFLAGVAAIVQ